MSVQTVITSSLGNGIKQMFHSCDFSHTGSLSAAESEIITLARYLRPRKIVVKHSYSYPDGSLYQVARSDEPASQLEEMINRTISFVGSRLLKNCQVTEIEATEEPYKALCETTEEYFTKGVGVNEWSWKDLSLASTGVATQ